MPTVTRTASESFAVVSGLILAILLILNSAALATTLTGTLNYPNTTGASGYLILSLSQQAALLASGGCGGPIEVVPTYQYRIKVTNGSLIGSPVVYGNDCMLPQGTYYNVQMTDTNANTLFTDRWVITGSTIDIGTIVSATITGTTQTLGQAGVILTQPTGSQTVVQQPATNLNVNLLNVTDTLTMPNGASCTTAGCSGFISNAVTTDTIQTITGQKTFTSDIQFGTLTSVGTAASPAAFGYYGLGVFTGQLVLSLGGNFTSPTDTHHIVNSSVGTVSIYNTDLSKTNLELGDNSGFDSNPLLAVPNGYISGDAGVITGNVHTGDFACSGFPDGLITVRSDTSPKQLQVCVGGTVFRTNLNP